MGRGTRLQGTGRIGKTKEAKKVELVKERIHRETTDLRHMLIELTGIMEGFIQETEKLSEQYDRLLDEAVKYK